MNVIDNRFNRDNYDSRQAAKAMEAELNKLNRPKYIAEEGQEPRFLKKRKFGAALLLAATSFFAGKAVGNNEKHSAEPINTGDNTEQVEQETHEYVVKPGDTLWGIARSELGPDAEVRGYVDNLSEQLGKDGILKAGQTLTLSGPGNANSGSIESIQDQT